MEGYSGRGPDAATASFYRGYQRVKQLYRHVGNRDRDGNPIENTALRNYRRFYEETRRRNENWRAGRFGKLSTTVQGVQEAIDSERRMWEWLGSWPVRRRWMSNREERLRDLGVTPEAEDRFRDFFRRVQGWPE